MQGEKKGHLGGIIGDDCQTCLGLISAAVNQINNRVRGVVSGEPNRELSLLLRSAGYRSPHRVVFPPRQEAVKSERRLLGSSQQADREFSSCTRQISPPGISGLNADIRSHI